MNTLLIVILALWVLGMPVAWLKVRDWSNGLMVRFAASVLWPLTCVLYGIWWLHNKF